MALIDYALPLFRELADQFAGSEFEAAARAKVTEVESLIAEHAKALDVKVAQWVADLAGLGASDQETGGAHAAPADPAEPVA